MHELVRELIGFLIDDIVAETGRRLEALNPQSADDVRGAAAPVAGFSPAVAEGDRAIKAFLFTRMYRNPRVMQVMGEAEGVVADLFARYQANLADLPVGMAGGLQGARRGRAGAAHRRFHRRHDRPLCARRACPAF